MIFQEHHREQIRTGEKTMTRRNWDENRVTVGKTYRATRGGNVEQGMFEPRETCDYFIRVLDVYEQPLGDMDDQDAAQEGGYTLSEFRKKWAEINDEWNPEQFWRICPRVSSSLDTENSAVTMLIVTASKRNTASERPGGQAGHPLSRAV